jgi:hypothetical protein
MKKILIISLLTSMVWMAACSSDSTDFTATEVESTVTTGTWKITYFYDTDKEETNHFAGYTFTFGEDGVLTAVNGGSTITGTWSVGEDSNDDSPSGPEFDIFFATPDDFEDLSDDWDILERTDTKLRLEDVSGGNGGTDQLTFEKI